MAGERRIGGGTRLAGVIGWPVEHSRSPQMHNAAYAALGMDWAYVAMPVRAGAAGAGAARGGGSGARGAERHHPPQAGDRSDLRRAVARGAPGGLGQHGADAGRRAAARRDHRRPGHAGRDRGSAGAGCAGAGRGRRGAGGGGGAGRCRSGGDGIGAAAGGGRAAGAGAGGDGDRLAGPRRAGADRERDAARAVRGGGPSCRSTRRCWTAAWCAIWPIAETAPRRA